MHSIITIQNGQIEYTNDRFLHQFQEPINMYGSSQHQSSLYDSSPDNEEEMDTNRAKSLCRYFQKTKKKESESKKEANKFLDLKLFE